MCLRKIWPQRFLDSPHHLLDGFWGPQDGFFGFSSGGYRKRGVKLLVHFMIHFFSACVFGICFVMLCLILMCRLKTRRCRRNAGGPNNSDHEHVVILNGVGGEESSNACCSLIVVIHARSRG